MAVSIRLAREDDLEAINAIYNHYVLTSTCTADVSPVDLEARQRWFDAHDAQRFPATVAATEAGEVLGWGSLSPYHPRWGYRFTVENSVYVRHDAHRQGVGAALLDDLIVRADDAGHRSIIALVTAEQPASLGLHERAGFVRRGHLEHVIHKMDRWIDLVLLQRDL